MSTNRRASRVISKVVVTLVVAAALAVLSWRLGYQAGHQTPCAEAYRAGQDSNSVFQNDAYASASREAYSKCLEAIRAGRDVWGMSVEDLCQDKEFGVRSAGPSASRNRQTPTAK